jgi:hypothetical protein
MPGMAAKGQSMVIQLKAEPGSNLKRKTQAGFD